MPHGCFQYSFKEMGGKLSIAQGPMPSLGFDTQGPAQFAQGVRGLFGKKIPS
jgi:hypothetical protein